MNTIDQLNASWDAAVQMAGHTNTPLTIPALLQSIQLVSRNDSLVIEQKPQRSSLDRLIRFFIGEPPDESFALQVSKIKQIFASLDTISEVEKARCLKLEERLQSLGRYVFVRRCEKTLFFASCPKLSDYQIRFFSETHALIKPNQIKRSLRNPTWRLCWLNSSLKFLAANTFYDEMLTTPVADQYLEKLRKTLFRLIEALRKNWDQHIINALHEELIKDLRMSAFSSFFNEQQDADEFIVQLSNHFPSPNRPQIEFVKIYSSFTENVWKPGTHQTTDKLQITPTNDSSFDIEQAYSAWNHFENIRDYITNGQPNQTQEELDFAGRDAVTGFGHHLEIMIKRSVGFDQYRNNGHVSEAKINLDENGTLTLVENEPIYKTIGDRTYIMAVRPKNLCTFRSIAAIERRGGSSAHGHYIAHTRAKDGSITTHDDYSISTNKTEAVWANAYYLMLELTDRMPIAGV